MKSRNKIRTLESKVLVDTNIIVRNLIDDNDKFSSLLSTADEVHIPLPIFFETIFVLEKVYKLPRETISEYIATIISYENIKTEEDILKKSMTLYTLEKGLSIIDCYLLTYAKQNKLEIQTLDKVLLKALQKRS